MHINEAIEVYIIAKQADGRAPRTIRDYRRVLFSMAAWLGDNGLPEEIERLDKSIIRRYVAFLRGRGLSDGTVGIHVRNLRAFLNWSYREGLIDVNLAKAISAPPLSVRPLRLTPEIFRQLLAAAEHTTMPRRNKAILLVLADTGLRLAEMVALNRDDVHFAEDGTAWLIVYMPKTRGYRNAFLGHRTTEALRLYLEERSDDLPPLWLGDRGARLQPRGMYTALYRIAKLAGVPSGVVHPHAFRKFFATQWIANGGDPIRLQNIGGWRGPEMLRVYVQLSHREDLHDGHRRYGPVDQL